MKIRAMILAAGLGTRLGEITKTTPKCLVTVAGKPLLQHAIEAVAGLGITDIAVNLHHHADQVRAFIQQLSGQRFAGQELRFHLEYENELLDTGGGVLNCRAFLAEADHFIVHNADVYSHIPLAKLYEEHLVRANTATLAVKHRESSRGLFFDRNGELRGKYGPKGEVILPGDWGTLDRCGFGGISIGSRGFLDDLAHYSGAFTIIDGFLTASQNGHRTGAFFTDQYYWADVGTPEKLAAVNEYVAGRGTR